MPAKYSACLPPCFPHFNILANDAPHSSYPTAMIIPTAHAPLFRLLYRGWRPFLTCHTDFNAFYWLNVDKSQEYYACQERRGHQTVELSTLKSACSVVSNYCPNIYTHSFSSTYIQSSCAYVHERIPSRIRIQRGTIQSLRESTFTIALPTSFSPSLARFSLISSCQSASHTHTRT